MRGMILAAGLGTRLGELTQTTPKCLMQLGGVTMLQHVAERLKAAGCNTLVVNTHYLAPAVRSYLENQDNFGIQIHLSHEESILGTGGALKHARAQLLGGDFFVHNSDIYSDCDLLGLLQHHRRCGALATLAVRRPSTASRVLVDEQQRWRGLWKEGAQAPSPPLQTRTYTGIQVISARAFDYMEQEEGAFPIWNAYLRALAAGELLGTFDIGNAEWIDIGTPAQLEEARLRAQSTQR